uniref:Uncharacterized protein n=1 Tax=Arion vulgaris TaxID=1028688 RepID=A0A0B7AWG6_9EUPU
MDLPRVLEISSVTNKDTVSNSRKTFDYTDLIAGEKMCLLTDQLYKTNLFLLNVCV